MAEQDACAQVVADAAVEDDADGGRSDHGESLLLPLLQAGAADDADEQVVAEARRALAKLQHALRAPAAPVSEPRRRALLALAARLGAGLATDAAPVPPARRRRHARNARHTVGVSVEELADARRLIEDADIHGEDADDTPDSNKRPSLQKQTSCGAVLDKADVPVDLLQEREPTLEYDTDTKSPIVSLASSRTSSIDAQSSHDEQISYHDAVTVRKKASPVVLSASCNSSLIKNRIINDHQISAEVLELSDRIDRSFQETKTKQCVTNLDSNSDLSESENEPITIKEKFESDKPNYVQANNKVPIIVNTIPQKVDEDSLSKTENREHHVNSFRKAPLYQPLPSTYNFTPSSRPPVDTRKTSKFISNGFSHDQDQPHIKPVNRFSNKKTKMKRANTIDIPKPLDFYQVDSDISDDDAANRNMNNVSAVKPTVPTFQPKTDNDHKFIAFIQKHNNESGSVWSPNKVMSQSAGHNWNSCFGNLKNTFENSSPDQSRSSSASSARKFWKGADDHSVNPVKPVNYNFKSNKQGVTDLKLNKAMNSSKSHEPQSEVVTGILKLSNPPMPNKIVEPKSKHFVAKPIPMNQFSHAPMSAFKPLPKIVSPVSAPPHIWSPPSFNEKQINTGSHTQPALSNSVLPLPNTRKSSITTAAPWAGSKSDKPKRVNLAASKFETSPTYVSPNASVPPPFREKAFVPHSNPQHNVGHLPVKVLPPQGCLAAPKLVKKIETNKKQILESGNATKEPVFPQKVDAQKLQIQFYEKQILEKSGKSGSHMQRRFSEHNTTLPYTYTVTDYSPPHISTFVPLQQTPDIEKVSSHIADPLPDVVLNENNQVTKGILKISSTYNDTPLYKNDFIKYNTTSELASTNGEDSKFPDNIEVDPVEYQAVSKVMKGPVSQQAVIKTNGVRTRNDDEQRDNAAKSLKGVLQMFSSPKRNVIEQIEKKKNDKKIIPPVVNDVIKQAQPLRSQSYKHQTLNKTFNQPIKTKIISNNVQLNNNIKLANKTVPVIKCSPASSTLNNNIEFKVRNNVFKMPSDIVYSSESFEINEDDTNFTSKKPPSPALYIKNAVSAVSATNSACSSTPSPNPLSKSESWHQLVNQQNAQNNNFPKSPSRNKVVTRAKSMHLLSVPKQFEAGIKQVQEKRKTVEAYFSGSVSPLNVPTSAESTAFNNASNTHNGSCEVNQSKGQAKVKSSINRTKTSAKLSTQSFSLGRSQTMPQMTYNDLKLLDESNADDAFEHLVNETLA